MCDLVGFFTCFESFTIPYILCIYLTIFWGLTITHNIEARSFNILRIGDFKNWWIWKTISFLDGVNLCLKFWDGNLRDMLT